MFGDIGHGFLIFVAGLLMILFERRLAKSDMGEVGYISLGLVQINHGIIFYRLWEHSFSKIILKI